MPDYAWTDGVAPSAATINANVREQVVTTCTSATRPTNVEGHLIYETNTDRVLLGTGSGSNWVCLAEPTQTWSSPTVSGLTAGNGTWDAGYRRHDGWCTARGAFTLGSTSSITGSLLVTLPYTPASASAMLGVCQFYDSSTSTTYVGTLGAWTTPRIILAVQTTSGTYATRTATSATIPFPDDGTTGDMIEFAVTFQMANRYD